MKCFVTNRLDGTGKCNNEAVQLTSFGQPVCKDCAISCNEIAELFAQMEDKMGVSRSVFSLPIIIHSEN